MEALVLCEIAAGCEDLREGLGPTALKLLALEPIWQAEPLPLMFP